MNVKPSATNIEDQLRLELLKTMKHEEVEYLISRIKSSSPPQLTHIIAVGPPCAGKGTSLGNYSQYTINAYPVETTSTLLKEASKANNAQGRKIAQIMAAGALVTEDVMIPLILQVLAEAKTPTIFDGLIRTRAQALAFMLAGIKFKMVWLSADRDTLFARANNRLVCPKCGTSYSKSEVTSRLCTKPNCGSELTTRPDDQKISKRIDDFMNETEPALNLLIQYGFKCLTIDTVALNQAEIVDKMTHFIHD